MARLRDGAADLRALIDATAHAMNIRAAFVEKDFWVTEMLRSVAAALEAGFPSALRPRRGFAASPAFSGAEKWTAAAEAAYARELPSLVWGRCPTFEHCIATVAAHGDLL